MNLKNIERCEATLAGLDLAPQFQIHAMLALADSSPVPEVHLAASIAAQAMLALRDLHMRNEHPEAFTHRIATIRKLLK